MISAIYFAAVAVFFGWQATWDPDPTWRIFMFVACVGFSIVSGLMWREAMRKEDKKQQTRGRQ